ncbi:MAG TPA: hypothetical protein VIB79_15470 [Candidatus Binatia bacterium]
MADTLPSGDKPLLMALQTALNRQLGGDVFSITDDGTHISLVVAPPGKPAVKVDGLGKDAGGIAGKLSLEGVSAAQPLAVAAFGGFTLAFTGFELTVANGRFTDAGIHGRLTIPFFADNTGAQLALNIDLAPNSNGPFSDPNAALVPVLSETQDALTNEGLALLHYVLPASSLDLQLATMQLNKGPDGNYAIELDGKVLLSIAGLNWPALDFHGLRIDSRGNAALEDGWINLPSQTAVDYFAFKLSLQKIGFGSDHGTRWIGFNGDLHLVEGIPLGGSVRGLRLNLNDGSLSLTGVTVDFEIPDVLQFHGDIEHVQAKSMNDFRNAGLPDSFVMPPELLPINVFLGDVHLTVSALPKPLDIDAKLIVGNIQGNSVFFLALGADLPVGIPIFLDVSLYGVGGLFASNLQPDPVAHGHTWWDWFKSPNTGGIAFPGGPDDFSATDVHKWLNPHAGALALGAGAVIGTSHDDGFTVSAAVTLVLMMPGPIVTLIGRANILSKRVSAANDQRTNFEALATFDGNADTFDLAVQAHYEIPIVLEIDGAGVLHAGPDGWYFALGKPPHDQRVRARIFDLFETNGYFVVSNDGLLTGTWIGYRNSWSFGPLSVSVNAFMATIQAMQWSPLQIGGGIEFHGEAHLSAFGVGLGIGVDALLEGSAPNPFWVHGDFHVELELPWPLPDVGATVSLTWGGDDGSVPPAPLALNHVDGTLIDHAATSDHYTLLEHRAGRRSSYDDNLQYDHTDNAPGILNVTNAAAWKTLAGGPDPLAVLPNITDLNRLPYAAVIPQDSHFTLTFAHPVYDDAGFTANQNWEVQPEIAQVKTPAVLGNDDMSNLTLDPPRPQWAFQHALKQVALYEFSGGAWQKIAALPKGDFPRDLRGGWLPARDSSGQDHPNTLLKVIPYELLTGDQFTASWDNSDAEYDDDFVDQELSFHLDPSVFPVHAGAWRGRKGLIFSGKGKLEITFAQPVQIVSIESIQVGGDNEFPTEGPMQWRGNGKSLGMSAPGASPGFIQYAPANTPPITKLSSTLGVPDHRFAAIFSILYKLPDIPMAILPDAPATYALKTVTTIQSGRVSDNTAFAKVGDPIMEFTYFQTASGPAIGVMKTPPPNNPPFPAVPPPSASLADKAAAAGLNPDSTFPRGGKISNLDSYTQWSWPEDGNVAAYYGYDVNVEFNESYINALYTGVPGTGSPHNSLHFRCVDRNGAHVLFAPNAIHVPSIYAQSALAAASIVPELPETIRPKLPVFHGIVDKLDRVELLAAVRSKLMPQAVKEDADKDPLRLLLDVFAQEADELSKAQEQIADDAFIETASELAVATKLSVSREAFSDVSKLDPVIAAKLIQAAEAAAANEAGALWFQPLKPRTRYTLDVVAGALTGAKRLPQPGSLAAIFSQHDAIGTLQALKAFYQVEDKLTALERVQFTTSRYRAFGDQLAGAVAQTKGTSGAPPLRRRRAAVDPIAWYTANGVTQRQLAQDYLNAATALGTFVSTFDPMGDNIPPINPARGQSGLAARRVQTEAAWQDFTAETIALYDKLIGAIGCDYLASNRIAPLPPDTELTALVDANDYILALLVESPEPLPWRRIWRWISLRSADPDPAQPSGVKSPIKTAAAAAGKLALNISPILQEFVAPGIAALVTQKQYSVASLRNRDGTRGLLIPPTALSGSWTLSIEFHGNIGAEAPCITAAKKAVLERVDFAPLLFRPKPTRLTPSHPAVSRYQLYRIITGRGGNL